MPRLYNATTGFTQSRKLPLTAIKVADYTTLNSAFQSILDESDRKSHLPPLSDTDTREYENSNVSLPSFSELIRFLESAPITPEEELAAARHQRPDATYYWHNFEPTYPRDHDPHLYINYTSVGDKPGTSCSPRNPHVRRSSPPSYGESLPDHQVGSLGHPTTTNNGPSPVSAFSVVSSKRSSQDLSIQTNGGSPTEINDVLTTSGGNWKDYVRDGVTEKGEKVLICRWTSDESKSLCSYYDEKSALVKRHVNITHLGIRAYRCSYCPRAFGQNTTRIIHEWKIHTLEKPLSCNRCDERFNDPARLSKHLKKVHGVVAKPRKEKPRIVQV